MSQKFALCLRYVPEIRLPVSILFPFFVLFSCQFFKNTSVNLFLMISGPHLVLRKQLPILWPLFLKVQISSSAICAFILSQKGRGFFPAFCTRDNPGYTEASAPAARVRRPCRASDVHCTSRCLSTQLLLRSASLVLPLERHASQPFRVEPGPFASQAASWCPSFNFHIGMAAKNDFAVGG